LFDELKMFRLAGDCPFSRLTGVKCFFFPVKMTTSELFNHKR